MHGYGVWITKRQLDEAISSSQSSATKLTRNLLSVFFSNATLASSSAYGTGKHAALDKNILSAIIGKSIEPHPRKHLCSLHVSPCQGCHKVVE